MPNYLTDADTYLSKVTPTFTPSSSTTPKDTDVTAYVAAREAELDFVLNAKGYSTPLTGTAEIEFVVIYLAQIVAYDIATARYGQDDLFEQYKNYWSDWRRFIKMILDEDVKFTSSSPAGDRDPAFGVIRTPVRDETFTRRYDTVPDWDE